MSWEEPKNLTISVDFAGMTGYSLTSRCLSVFVALVGVVPVVVTAADQFDLSEPFRGQLLTKSNEEAIHSTHTFQNYLDYLFPGRSRLEVSVLCVALLLVGSLLISAASRVSRAIQKRKSTRAHGTRSGSAVSDLASSQSEAVAQSADPVVDEGLCDDEPGCAFGVHELPSQSSRSVSPSTNEGSAEESTFSSKEERKKTKGVESKIETSRDSHQPHLERIRQETNSSLHQQDAGILSSTSKQPYDALRIGSADSIELSSDSRDSIFEFFAEKLLYVSTGLTRLPFTHCPASASVIFVGRNVDQPKLVFRNPAFEKPQRSNIRAGTQAIRAAVASSVLCESSGLRAYIPKAMIGKWNGVFGVFQEYVKAGSSGSGRRMRARLYESEPDLLTGSFDFEEDKNVISDDRNVCSDDRNVGSDDKSSQNYKRSVSGSEFEDGPSRDPRDGPSRDPLGVSVNEDLPSLLGSRAQPDVVDSSPTISYGSPGGSLSSPSISFGLPSMSLGYSSLSASCDSSGFSRAELDSMFLTLLLRDTDAHDGNRLTDIRRKVAIYDLGCCLADEALSEEDIESGVLDNFDLYARSKRRKSTLETDGKDWSAGRELWAASNESGLPRVSRLDPSPCLNPGPTATSGEPEVVGPSSESGLNVLDKVLFTSAQTSYLQKLDIEGAKVLWANFVYPPEIDAMSGVLSSSNISSGLSHLNNSSPLRMLRMLDINRKFLLLCAVNEQSVGFAADVMYGGLYDQLLKSCQTDSESRIDNESKIEAESRTNSDSRVNSDSRFSDLDRFESRLLGVVPRLSPVESSVEMKIEAVEGVYPSGCENRSSVFSSRVGGYLTAADRVKSAGEAGQSLRDPGQFSRETGQSSLLASSLGSSLSSSAFSPPSAASADSILCARKSLMLSNESTMVPTISVLASPKSGYLSEPTTMVGSP